MGTFAAKPRQKLSTRATRSNRVGAAASQRAHPLVHLQRSIGNKATLRSLQARADHVGVGSDNGPGATTQEAPGLTPTQTRLQTKRAGSSNSGEFAAPPLNREVLASPGKPLDKASRAFMEPRFGRDFSSVRVHADVEAAESARAVQAKAYTLGRDVVFAAGHYAPESREGRTLLAHELAHVVQQGFAPPQADGRSAIGPTHHSPSSVQRDKKGPTKMAVDFRDVFNEVKSRNPDLAEFITPQSLVGNAPPLVKGGPSKPGEEHVWSVSINRVPVGSSRADSDGETRQKVGKITRVTHKILITWVFPRFIDPDFLKQTKTEKEAFNLTITEPLFHELLHARLMMERSPDYVGQHTSVYQGYQNIIAAANSTGVAQERKVVRDQIAVMMLMNNTKPAFDVILKAQDSMLEFLVHEKYDAQTEYGAFGKTVTNAKIALAYSKVVGARVDIDVSHDSDAADRFWEQQVRKLEGFLVKFYDKIDQSQQQGQATQPSPGTQPSPAQPSPGQPSPGTLPSPGTQPPPASSPSPSPKK